MPALDISEWQVILDLPAYQPRFHHRVMLRRVSGSTWILASPQWVVGVRDLKDIPVTWLERNAPFPAGFAEADVSSFDVRDPDLITRLRKMRDDADNLSRTHGGEDRAAANARVGVSGGASASLAPAAVGGGEAGSLHQRVNMAPKLGGADPRDDARTLPVRFNASGQRFRQFSEGVDMLTETDWQDFPVSKPRTVLWVCREFVRLGYIPTAWHEHWASVLNKAVSDEGVEEHETFCKALEAAISFDMINVSELACWEIHARRFQMHEERERLDLLEAERGKSTGSTGAALGPDERHLMMGQRSVRGNAIVCPALLQHLSDELKAEAAVSKERRKAREERELARKPQGQKK